MAVSPFDESLPVSLETGQEYLDFSRRPINTDSICDKIKKVWDNSHIGLKIIYGLAIPVVAGFAIVIGLCPHFWAGILAGALLYMLLSAYAGIIITYKNDIIKFVSQIFKSASKPTPIDPSSSPKYMKILPAENYFPLGEQQHQMLNNNKKFVYNKLIHRHPDILKSPVTRQKFELKDPNALNNEPIFSKTKCKIEVVTGTFQYSPSTEDTITWTANFADPNPFSAAGSYNFAQDEIQVAEHPSLVHIRHLLPDDNKPLEIYQADLHYNVPRAGQFDTMTKFENGPLDDKTLYGNNFTNASEEEITSKLDIFKTPTNSNIFLIIAPTISPIPGESYKKDEIEALFGTAYIAFYALEASSPGKTVIVETGNWGTGAYGNSPQMSYLLQIAAARFAGIDVLKMYPLDHTAALQEAMELFEQIEKDYPEMTIDGFFDLLTDMSTRKQHGLVSGTPNRT